MFVVFLDFDGVLNSAAHFTRVHDSYDPKFSRWDFHLWEIDEAAVAILDDLCARTGAKVVVSSTWRLGIPVDDLQALLSEKGFRGEVIDVTRPGRDERGLQIADWLKDKTIDSFVILDDDGDMAHLMPYLVKTDNSVGLTEENAERAFKLLTGT